MQSVQALLMLLANGRVPDAITTVFGNVPLAQATDNILAVLAVAGADVPVHAGAVQPLAQAPVHAQYIHGDDGLGGAPRPAVSAQPAGHDAEARLFGLRQRRAARHRERGAQLRPAPGRQAVPADDRLSLPAGRPARQRSRLQLFAQLDRGTAGDADMVELCQQPLVLEPLGPVRKVPARRLAGARRRGSTP